MPEHQQIYDNYAQSRRLLGVCSKYSKKVNEHNQNKIQHKWGHRRCDDRGEIYCDVMRNFHNLFFFTDRRPSEESGQSAGGDKDAVTLEEAEKYCVELEGERFDDE